jgi:hypothetical protein
MKKSLYLLKILLLFTCIAVAQPPNSGYYLDGVDDFIELNDTDNINTTIVRNRTIEGYFKVDDATGRQVIYEEGGNSRGILIYVENDYVVVGAFNRASDYTPRWDGTYFREPISDNTWYHVALVFDNASTPVNNPIAASDNTSLKWYLDGTLMDSRAGFEVRGHSGDINLGRSDSNMRFPNCSTWTSGGSSEYCFNNITQISSGNYFAGNVWGFRIWNDVRTATEIDTNKDVLITSVGTDDLVAALDGDTISYLDDSDAVTTDTASNKTVITWSTSASTTSWTTGSNWVGGVAPDATKLESVVIPSSASNYPVLTGHTVVGELTLSSSASITVNAGATLDVYYDITNNGTITVENDGALLTRKSIPVKGTGNYVVKRDSPNYTDRYFYSFWSTPIDETNSVIATIFPNVGGYNYYWDASATNAFWNNNQANMEVGRGYAFRANHFNVETATYDGTVNNGDITEPVFYTNDPNTGESGYNIIGNPYPSAIDWQRFHADNSDEIEGTVYYWRQTDAPVGDNLASDYIEYNNTGSNPLGAADGNIGVAQGFAVQAKSTGSGSVTFKNAHRLVANNTQFFRANNTDVAFTTESTTTSNSTTDGRLSLRMAGNGLYVTQLLGFIPQGTISFDDKYDGTFINEGAGIEFYSYTGTDKLSIQALPALNNIDVEVPLGYQVLSSGTYTVSIDAEYLSQDFDIILEDRYQGTFTDLRQTAYTFTTSPTEENDRFFLNIQYRNTLSIDEVEIAADEVQVLFSGDDLQTITKRTDIETIALYDISGKQLLQREYTSNILMPQLAKGVYIVQYTTENGAVLTRKILKS